MKQLVSGYTNDTTVIVRVEEKQKQDGTYWNHSMGGRQKDCISYYLWQYMYYM